MKLSSNAFIKKNRCVFRNLYNRPIFNFIYCYFYYLWNFDINRTTGNHNFRNDKVNYYKLLCINVL